MGKIIFAVAAVIVLYAIIAYNRLVRLRNRIENAWSQIDVQLRRRYDLIPNLVETVKGYAAHEKEVFQKVTEARAKAINATGAAAQGQAENALSGALKSLFAVAENYPDLKANQNFLMLQEELAGTEGKIAYSRQFYNDMVMMYDTSRQTFPTSVVPGVQLPRQGVFPGRRGGGARAGEGEVLISGKESSGKGRAGGGDDTEFAATMGASPFVHCHPLYAGRARVKKSVVRYPGTIANARPRIGSNHGAGATRSPTRSLQ